MAIHEGNGPVPQDAYVILRGITLKDGRRITFVTTDKVFDEHVGHEPENPEEMRATDQRSASLEQDSWQPRLAMEGDITLDKKTRERTECANATSSSEAWGWLFCKKGPSRPDKFDQFRHES